MKTRTLTVTTTMELDDQFLSDILTTAMEGGVGYWLQVGEVHRAGLMDKGAGGLDHMSIYQVDDPMEADGSAKFDVAQFMPGFKVYRDRSIDLDTVFRGLQRLFEPNMLPHRDDIRRSILEMDLGNIDSDSADTIVQLGFFGEVVYG